MRYPLTSLFSIAALMLVAAAMPPSLHAQQQDVTAPVPEEALTAYARAFQEVAVVREEIHAELAANTNKSLDAQVRLRERMKEEVDEIVEAHGLTRERYARITLMVSVDQDHRERFDRILERLDSETEAAQ